MKEIDKLNYRHKLEMIDELIAEFRENASLVSVKNQIKGILGENPYAPSNISIPQCMVNISNGGQPKEFKPCLVQTDSGLLKAFFFRSYDGYTLEDIDTHKIITEPVRAWSYITD